MINDYKADSIIGLLYEAALNKILKLKSSLNNFSRKSKTLLRYWKQLKLNNKGILVKVTSKIKQIVFLQNYHSIFYTELHKNWTFGTQKSS